MQRPPASAAPAPPKAAPGSCAGAPAAECARVSGSSRRWGICDACSLHRIRGCLRRVARLRCAAHVHGLTSTMRAVRWLAKLTWFSASCRACVCCCCCCCCCCARDLGVSTPPGERMRSSCCLQRTVILAQVLPLWQRLGASRQHAAQAAALQVCARWGVWGEGAPTWTAPPQGWSGCAPREAWGRGAW